MHVQPSGSMLRLVKKPTAEVVQLLFGTHRNRFEIPSGLLAVLS